MTTWVRVWGNFRERNSSVSSSLLISPTKVSFPDSWRFWGSATVPHTDGQGDRKHSIGERGEVDSTTVDWSERKRNKDNLESLVYRRKKNRQLKTLGKRQGLIRRCREDNWNRKIINSVGLDPVVLGSVYLFLFNRFRGSPLGRRSPSGDTLPTGENYLWTRKRSTKTEYWVVETGNSTEDWLLRSRWDLREVNGSILTGDYARHLFVRHIKRLNHWRLETRGGEFVFLST